jgi:hypothetical protein
MLSKPLCKCYNQIIHRALSIRLRIVLSHVRTGRLDMSSLATVMPTKGSEFSLHWPLASPSSPLSDVLIDHVHNNPQTIKPLPGRHNPHSHHYTQPPNLYTNPHIAPLLGRIVPNMTHCHRSSLRKSSNRRRRLPGLGCLHRAQMRRWVHCIAHGIGCRSCHLTPSSLRLHRHRTVNGRESRSASWCSSTRGFARSCSGESIYVH